MIITPPAPTRRGRQFVEIHQEDITGSTIVDIIPGYHRDIPQHWRLIDMLMSCSTSAVAGNRELKIVKYVEIDKCGQNGSSTGITGFKTPGIPASSSPSFQISDMSFDALGTFSVPLLTYAQQIGPWGLVICGYDRIHAYLNSPKSGDTWSIRITLQYLNRILGMEER